jgi:hypothetical protein
MRRLLFLTLCLILTLTACAPAAQPTVRSGTAASSGAGEPLHAENTPTVNPSPTLTATTDRGHFQNPFTTRTVTAASGTTLTAAAEPLNPTPTPQAWMALPVVPSAVSQTMIDVYTLGLALGNDPNAFIKIGDCDSTPAWFLGMFEASNGDYSLGADYAYLQGVIDHFQGSFGRDSAAARQGFNAASVLSPLWADPAQCEEGETPLDCELRIMNPSFALITLGTNDTVYPDNFEGQLRQIIEVLLERGVVPILSTKADNIEGDHQINQVIVSLAYEYDLPLWNFWSVVQPLWRHGLQEDHAHLTWASSHFDEPENMEMAFPWRNLTALQTLDAVWRGVNAGQ